MKNIFKIFAISALAVALFSCQDDEYPRGPMVPADSIGAYFNYTSLARTYSISNETSINLNITRTETTEEKTITLDYSGDLEAFTVPETVTFNSGSKTTVLTIGIAFTELWKTHTLNIDIRFEDTNVYDQKTIQGRTAMTLNVAKESWESIGTAKVTDPMLGEAFGMANNENITNPNAYKAINPPGGSNYEMYELRNVAADGNIRVGLTDNGDGTYAIDYPTSAETTTGYRFYALSTQYSDGTPLILYWYFYTDKSGKSRYIPADKTIYLDGTLGDKTGSMGYYGEMEIILP